MVQRWLHQIDIYILVVVAFLLYCNLWCACAVRVCTACVWIVGFTAFSCHLCTKCSISVSETPNVVLRYILICIICCRRRLCFQKYVNHEHNRTSFLWTHDCSWGRAKAFCTHFTNVRIFLSISSARPRVYRLNLFRMHTEYEHDSLNH